jgi:hypothetical protein
MNDSLILRHLIWLLTHDAAFYQHGYVELLQPEFFEDRPLRWLVEKSLAYNAEYGSALPRQSIDVMLESMSDADFAAAGFEAGDVAGLLDTADAHAVEEDSRGYILNAIRQWARKQNITRHVEEIVDGQLDTDPDAAIDMLRGLHIPDLIEDDEISLQDDVAQILRDRQKRDRTGGRFTTGFDRIDELLRGGMRRRELAVVLAGTGVGKSNFLAWVARCNVKMDDVVLVYTLEMPKDDWYVRVLAALTRIPHTDLADDPVRSAKAVKRIMSLYQIKRGNVIVRELPEGARTVAHIRQDFDKLVLAGKKPDIVIVDYADHLRPARKYEKVYEALGEVYADLHTFAVEKDVLVWTASQANREALGRSHLSLRHFADSIKKAHVADYIFALCQTLEEKKGEKDGQQTGDGQERMRIGLLKARRSAGVGRELHVAADQECAIFRPVISPEFEESMADEDPEYPAPRGKYHYD